MTSNNISTSLIIERSRLAVHIALFYASGKVFGCDDFRIEMSRELAVLLDSDVYSNLWDNTVDNVQRD
jgi:hypothetical protein